MSFLLQRRLAHKLQPSVRRAVAPTLSGYTSHDHHQHQQQYKSHYDPRQHSWTTGGSFRFKSVVPSGTYLDGTPTVKSPKDSDAPMADPDDVIEEMHRKGKPWILDFGVPSLVPEWKKMFSKETLLTDISAGVTVGCIAVPLSLAIAVASGVPAEVGLVTAVVSGVAGGMLGGTTLAVTGPAAAISLLVVGAVTEHGLEALPFITLGCGALQLASGVTRLGVAAKLVPVSVIAGFTTGVGIMILSGQAPKALGITAPAGMNPIETATFLGEHIMSINPASAALAAGTAGAMIFLPKLHPKMPSALLAVGGATVATHSLGLDVSLIGTIPHGLSAFQFGVPIMPPLKDIPSLTSTIFLIYALTSAESLLSCAALEKMKKTSYKHSPDQELIGQGLANMGAAMFMGMPVTSVIARSSLNVKLNAQTRFPAIFQAGFVFSGVVFFSQTISSIPMPALSGMLIVTGISMLNPTEFKHCYAVEKMDTIPFLTTIAGMMNYGLAEGIGIGCITAGCLIYDYGQLHAHEIQLPIKTSDVQYKLMDDQTLATAAATNAEVVTTAWRLKGPINFRNMLEIDDLALRIKECNTIRESIVLDMRGISSVEFTGVEELANRLVEIADDKGTTIQMWNCSDNLQNALLQCDPNQRILANCHQSTAELAPYTFPLEEEEKFERMKTPMWSDSVHFDPSAVIPTTAVDKKTPPKP